MKRYLKRQVEKDLKKKMVFVAGARQVGKTTLAKQLLGDAEGYLNWDIPEHRERILKRELPVDKFWVFVGVGAVILATAIFMSVRAM